jgi:hypothetical protein
LVNSQSESLDASQRLEAKLRLELMKLKAEVAERRSEQRARDNELQQIIQSDESENSIVTVKSYEIDPNNIITFIEEIDQREEDDPSCFEGCRVWLGKCECF